MDPEVEAPESGSEANLDSEDLGNSSSGFGVGYPFGSDAPHTPASVTPFSVAAMGTPVTSEQEGNVSPQGENDFGQGEKVLDQGENAFGQDENAFGQDENAFGQGENVLDQGEINMDASRAAEIVLSRIKQAKVKSKRKRRKKSNDDNDNNNNNNNDDSNNNIANNLNGENDIVDRIPHSYKRGRRVKRVYEPQFDENGELIPPSLKEIIWKAEAYDKEKKLEKKENGKEGSKTKENKSKETLHSVHQNDSDDDNDAQQENNSGPTIAPRVRIVDGKIVLDEQSLHVAADISVREDRENYKRVEESGSKVNYASYTNRLHHDRWTNEDTAKFYKALQQFGTDFQLISKLFPGRTRRHMLYKFKKEETLNPIKVNAALSSPSTDTSFYYQIIENLKAKKKEKNNLENGDDIDANDQDQDDENQENQGDENVTNANENREGEIEGETLHNQAKEDITNMQNDYGVSLHRGTQSSDIIDDGAKTHDHNVNSPEKNDGAENDENDDNHGGGDGEEEEEEYSGNPFGSYWNF